MMNATMGNVALKATSNAQAKMDMVQVDYICRSYEVAKCMEIRFDKKGRPLPTGLEPLIIKHEMHRLPSGYANLIELHGYYTREVAEEAIFQLKDTNMLSDDIITELGTDDNGVVTALRFIRPLMRLRNTY